MELKETIAKRLKEIRVQNDLSQLDIAKELNMTQAAIAQYEMAKNMPSPDILFWYAERFDISLDFIFGRSDKQNGSASYDFAKPGSETNQLLREVIKAIMSETNKNNHWDSMVIFFI